MCAHESGKRPADAWTQGASASEQVEEAAVVMEDDFSDEPVSVPGVLRNLSAWSISIPYIDIYDDEAKRERTPVFCIDVERNDRKDGEWAGGRGGGGQGGVRD